MKVYYAHFMGLYNTLQEQRDIETLEQLGLEVVNPNVPNIQVEVEYYKKYFMKHEDSYMKMFKEVFFNRVDKCEVFAFRSLPDGRIPGGVALELEQAKLGNKIIIELPSGFHSRKMNGDQTREYLTEMGQR